MCVYEFIFISQETHDIYSHHAHLTTVNRCIAQTRITVKKICMSQTNTQKKNKNS